MQAFFPPLHIGGGKELEVKELLCVNKTMERGKTDGYRGSKYDHGMLCAYVGKVTNKPITS